MSSLSYTRRAIPWASAGVATAPTVALGVLAVVHRDATWASSVMYASLLLLVMPAAFVLDEPSAPAVAAAPRSPWWCHLRRLAGLAPLAVVAVTAVTAVSAWSHVVELEQGGLVVLTVVSAMLISAAAAAVARAAGRITPGDVVAGAGGIVVAGLFLFGPTVRGVELLPTLGTASSAEIGLWIVLGVTAFGVLALTPLRRPTGAVDA
jgi:hypothetical protein